MSIIGLRGGFINPKISIIVPVYNTEPYLAQCLDSIINQSFKDIEIIVVNDCSPGSCRAIVSKYQRQDSRIRFIDHKKNIGTLGARFSGYEAAIGTYIQTVDSDDSLTADACEKIYNALRESGADICHIGMLIYKHPNKQDPFYWDDETTNKIFTPKNGLYTINQWIDDLVKPAVDNCMCSHVVKKEAVHLLLNIAGKSKHLVMLEDFFQVFLLSCFVKGSIVFLEDKIYEYRMGVGVMSRLRGVTQLSKQLNDLLYVYQVVEQRINMSENYSPKQREAYKVRVQYDISHFLWDYIHTSEEDQKAILARLKIEGNLESFYFYLTTYLMKSKIIYINHQDLPHYVIKFYRIFEKLFPKGNWFRPLARFIYHRIQNIYRILRGKI